MLGAFALIQSRFAPRFWALTWAQILNLLRLYGFAGGGAELYSDGGFVGNTPSTLKLSVGKHVIKVTAAGHKEWSREITVQAGSELSLNAVLEAQ
jgi:hypothetical protein